MMLKSFIFSLALVAVCLLSVSNKQQAEAGLLDMLQDYMEKDLAGCVGEQRELKDFESLIELRNPEPKCKAKCEHEELSYTSGDYKYSGSSVLCCCKKQ